MANLVEILESEYFLWALGLGGACLVVGHLKGLRTPTARIWPIGGFLITLSATLAISFSEEVPQMVWVALAVIALLTLLARSISSSALLTAALCIPGTALLAFSIPSEPDWVTWGILVLTPFVGFFVDEFDTRYREHGLGVIFIGLATMGTFLAVPDTEWARALFAASFAIAFLSWPRVVVSLGSSGSHVASALFVYVTVTGGEGRPASIIGALTCLGFIVLEPAVSRALPRLRELPHVLVRSPESLLVASIPQFILVLLASRIAARFASPEKALLVSTIVVAVGVSLLMWIERSKLPDMVGSQSRA